MHLVERRGVADDAADRQRSNNGCVFTAGGQNRIRHWSWVPASTSVRWYPPGCAPAVGLATPPNHHSLPGEDLILDGLRLHVVRHGRPVPDRPPVLLLHGAWARRPICGAMSCAQLAMTRRASRLTWSGSVEVSGSPPSSTCRAKHSRCSTCSTPGRSAVIVAGHDIGGSIAVHLVSLAWIALLAGAGGRSRARRRLAGSRRGCPARPGVGDGRYVRSSARRRVLPLGSRQPGPRS